MRLSNFIRFTIMKPGDPCLSEGSTAATGVISRRRPLYTCGSSILGIGYCVCTKAQEFNGPLGSVTKKWFKLIASGLPCVYPLLYQWLALLSFADDYILNAETLGETMIPPATCVFNKIDDLVYSAEKLPTKLDGALNTFPSYVHQFPLLDWALGYFISWLNFFICTLSNWGSDVTSEKEIRVDVNCHDYHPETETTEEGQCQETKFLRHEHQDRNDSGEDPFPLSHLNQATNKAMYASQCSFDSPHSIQYEDAMSSPTDDFSYQGIDLVPDSKNCSYKDILQKGTKENAEKNKDSGLEMSAEGIVGEEKDLHSSGTSTEDDPILNQFEAR